MAIYFGVRPETDYAKMPNQWARDPKLSLKAKGLLIYLLSHREGYRLPMEQVIAEVADGKASVYASVRELIERGYLERRQRRAAGGRVGEVDYYIIDAPGDTASQSTASRKPVSGDDQGKPDVSAVQTAYRFSAYGSTAYGKSNTKKTKNLEDQPLEDQKTTPPPTPSQPAVATSAAAPNPEEGEEGESSKEQKLADTIRGIRPAWTNRKIRKAIQTAVDDGRPWPLIVAAFPICAADTATQSPGRFPHDGPWWAQAEEKARPASREERIAVHCRFADTQPPCEHEVAGGNLPLPGDGWQPCSMCRDATRRATAVAEPAAAVESTSAKRARQAMAAGAEVQAAYDRGEMTVLASLYGSVPRTSRSPADQRVADNQSLLLKYAALDGVDPYRIYDTDIIEGDVA